MKFHSAKFLLIVLLLLLMLGIVGCERVNYEEAEQKILESLQVKYDKEFVPSKIGGGWGTMNNNTIKGIVHPKDDLTIYVYVEITKDLQHVYDNYLNHMVARAAEKPIEEMANSIWGECRIKIYNDTGLVYPEHTDTSMSYEQFLKLYPMNWQLIKIYLNSDNYIDEKGIVNQEEEIARYKAFTQKLVEQKYMRSSISVWYITPEAYNLFDEAKKSDGTIINYYKDIEKNTGKVHLVTGIGFDINEQGQFVTTTQKINKNFDVWQEERINSVKQKEDRDK